MINQISVSSLLCAALVLGGCAMRAAQTQTASAAPTRASACLHQTGSRIPATGANCTAYGRAYSSNDISVTGASTLGGALRLMDPTVTISH